MRYIYRVVDEDPDDVGQDWPLMWGDFASFNERDWLDVAGADGWILTAVAPARGRGNRYYFMKEVG